MAARALRYAVNGLLALIALAGAWGWYESHPEWWPQYRKGQELIARVEAYRKAHGRLPASQEEVAPEIDESGPAYYDRTGDQTYIVWFGRSLGESYTYDSSTGSWR